MVIHSLDPLTDPRWPEFLERHPKASVFHSVGWLRALAVTYGYRPVVLTGSAPGEPLRNGVLFCEVKSWITGRRLVSVPFSDHCDLLLQEPGDGGEFVEFLSAEVKRQGLKYVEFRPRTEFGGEAAHLTRSGDFVLHTVNLDRSEQEILESFHKDSIRRKIARAEREKLTFEKGVSAELLEGFYRLMVITRKRHGLPPAPIAWFSSLIRNLGSAVQIWIACRERQPVAGMLTLSFKDSTVYKYGCSDARYNNLGGMPFLFWMRILAAKAEGSRELDLGRSEADNMGLITFKRRLGASESPLTYWRLPANPRAEAAPGGFLAFSKRVAVHTPDWLRIGVGHLLYKHLG
ncbi:MAG TPA: GNAT family N-acetyltransferase [Terriglobales bacterium]|nr:GNAT family N-acetyltransferase [Terriglobales bacterium]